jgi:hypothetical protein
MIQIVKNRFVDALLKLILLSAIFHMALLILFSIVNLDLVILNYFNILDIDLLFPNIIEGVLSQLLSIAMVIIIYSLIFVFFTKK